ncbi:MAG: hypothetical protein M0013_12725 [Actinomycetota bacterium]|nr:hypothetical protein [Actinomycetota bacterium]
MERTRASTTPARRGDWTHPGALPAASGPARPLGRRRIARAPDRPTGVGLSAVAIAAITITAAVLAGGPVAAASRFPTQAATPSTGARLAVHRATVHHAAVHQLATPEAPPPAPAAAAGSGGPTAAVPASSPQPALRLVHQAWTVGPGQAFTATVDMSGGRASQLAMTVSVFSRLHTRTALSQTLSGTVRGVVRFRSDPIPLGSLPTTKSGQYQVDLALQTPDSTTRSTTAGGTAPGAFGPAALRCTLDQPGTCGGVYPVEIQVGPAGDAASATLVTELVYAYPGGNPYHATSPLRVALVVPLVTAGAASTPPTGSVAQLELLARAVTASASVPLTVVPEPAALEELGHSPSALDRQTLAAMDAAINDPAHQALLQSYVPVDATALVNAGLTEELTDQVSRACRELGPPKTTIGTWVAGAALDDAAAAALSASTCNPVRRLVLPASSVTGGGCTITCTAPFTVNTGQGSPLTAMEADSQLASEITAPTPDPVLQAHQLLADLSLTYFEAPGSAQARGVVLAVPPGAAVSPDAITGLVRGLAVDPALTPVTLAQLFAQVPVGANGQPATRRLIAPGGTHGLPVRALQAARSQLTAYTSAVGSTPAGQLAVTQLAGDLLRTESIDLRPVEQLHAVAAFERSLGAELGRVTLSGGVIRLTSSSVLRVPIALGSTTGFPVAGTLTVSSDKLLFTPGGQCRGIDRGPAGFSGVSCPVVLSKVTNAVYVSMRARIGGDFRVAVTLDAPAGGLALVHGQLTVRSLSTSVEAIVLSVAAGAVLLAWWVRTGWRTRRRARHGRHPRGATSSGAPAAAATGGPSPGTPAPA